MPPCCGADRRAYMTRAKVTYADKQALELEKKIAATLAEDETVAGFGPVEDAHTPGIERVVGYRVGERIFTSKKEAQRFLSSERLDQLLADGAVGRGGEWTAGMFRDWMLDEGWG